MTNKIGLFVFRRDLRIFYNTAFTKALEECDSIIPIFIFTPEQINSNTYKSNKSVQFMIESLDDLKQSLQDKDGELNIYHGKNTDVIERLIKKYDVDSLYLNIDYTPYSKKRDKLIHKLCIKHEVSFNTYHDVCLFVPRTITTDNSNDVYEKFTPFYNKCLENIDNITFPEKGYFKHNWCKKINDDTRKKINNVYTQYTVPSYYSLLRGGRNVVCNTLKNIKDFKDYDKTRDNLNKETTQLSAYLKYGCISVKELYKILIDNNFDKKHSLIRQLIWRDFYIHILDSHPRVLNGKAFKEKYESLKWDNTPSYFDCWKKGYTGFPIVDACMRQLNTVGYMQNRGRLIVASFLIKTLFIDWRKGEKYFAKNLIDYDPAANNGNWQWVAGSGVDSQPYFRIFNPWSQGEKHDKEAEFIKKWCPELKNVPSKDIHKWYEKHEKYINDGIDYPKPIVDYSKKRKYVLEQYKKVV